MTFDENDTPEREANHSKLESEVAYIMRHASKRSSLYSKEEIILRAELAILLDEKQRNRVESKILPSNLQDESAYMGDYIAQAENYIVSAMQKRLSSQGIILSNLSIRSYLRRVSKVFKAAELSGQALSAIPYLSEVKRKRRNKPLKMKKGKKRPIFHKGKPYGSIREAANATGENYNTLISQKWREYKNQI